MDLDAALAELEATIVRRRRWRGKPVFYQTLEYDLAPIIAAAEDPTAVRALVRSMLERHGHAPEPPAITSCSGDLGYLCNTVVPPRG